MAKVSEIKKQYTNLQARLEPAHPNVGSKDKEITCLKLQAEDLSRAYKIGETTNTAF